MKLTDEYEMSEWAYEQCRNGNDTPEMRDLITDSIDAFRYCKNVKDRPEMWVKINDSFAAYWYCKEIKDRPEVKCFMLKSETLGDI